MNGRAIRIAASVVLLGGLLARVGPGPVLDGLRAVDLPTVLAVLALGAVSTVAAARRWREIGLGLGVDVPMSAAVPAYYRSQLLNSVLPGGVAGDVDRGLRHGRDAGSAPLGLRVVAWDRLSGQSVQVLLTAVLLMVLSPRLRPVGAVMAAALLALVVAVLVSPRPVQPRSRIARSWAVLRDDVRRGLVPRRSTLTVVALSLVVVAGTATTFLLAARAAGATDLVGLVPVALLVLVAMAVPLHVAGWGIREGVAAWAFTAVGLGADLGVRSAVVFGVVATVATLPGLLVIASGRRARMREVVLDG
ncbi:MAG TPA: lysylphosphatidylglycerol synthase transmembrane domain-containing protein [Candidatus Nanopelagicales bacterium]|nr:lysylphosphatidylglycerol synthase transmembrane domain-containing protein [Candidatus Nanopelagicales bacterium]